ncbi:hypothetical protein Tco_0829891 [Tanacetum coccineum]
MTGFPQLDSGLAIPVFSLGDDTMAYLNKAMAFLTVVASLRFPSTNNQLRTSSNLRNQATIYNGRVTVQQVQRRQGQSYAGTGYKGEGHITEDLDAYNSDYDDVSNAKVVLIANSNYGSDVILETAVQDTNLYTQQDSLILSVIEQMSVQMLNHKNNWEKANQEMNNKSLTAELERYKEQVKVFEQRLNIDLSTREKMIDSQMDDMIKDKLALKQQIDSLEQNISNQIKEKESLLQTFTVFKNESKEKENKYMENEIDLKKKIKELDNIVYKVGQSAQTVHIQHVAIHVVDDDETLILEEVSRSKMSKKVKDQEAIKQNISHKPIDYVKMNQLSEDFGKRFIPQQELSAEQGFRFQMSNPTTESFHASQERIKSMKENDKEEKVKQDMNETETIKVELEHIVAKLLSDNKQHSEYLILQLNSKSVENADLKVEIQDKVFVITSLKNDLRKLKGKEIVENVAQIPSTTIIAPGMFKLDLYPLAPRLLQNRDVYIDYLKHTQEQADILWGIVEQAKAKQPLDNALDFACKHAKRIQELLVYVRDTRPNAI